jgi:phosphoribosyl-AMP cyclohydrolase
MSVTYNKSKPDERYYGVRKGHNRGVYTSYAQCKAQISNFRYPSFRKFDDFVSAHRFAFPELYPLERIIEEESNWIKSDKQCAEELVANTFKMIDYVNSEKMTVKIPKVERFDKMVNIWISGSIVGNGKIGVLFDSDFAEKNGLSKCCFIEMYLWNKPLNVTRLRLAACIKTVELMEEFKLTPCTLIVHTENAYLAKGLKKWTVGWFSRNKDKLWATSEPNRDLLLTLFEKASVAKIHISCVHSELVDHNLQKISELVKSSDDQQ